jgi:hypothetical protein
MDSLTRGLKILSELDKQPGKNDSQGNGDTNTVNYIQVLMNQLQIPPYEPKIN